MTKDQRGIQRKPRMLRHVEETGHLAKACRYFRVGRTSICLGDEQLETTMRRG